MKYGDGQHIKKMETEHRLVRSRRRERVEWDEAKVAEIALKNAQRLNAGRTGVWTSKGVGVSRRSKNSKASDGAPMAWCECNGFEHRAFSMTCTRKG